MSGNLNPNQFPPGTIIDEWSRWQQGQCGTYATALIKHNPKLKLGGVSFDDEGTVDHFVAHDGVHAYDSAGKHPLPYNGVHGNGMWLGDIGHPEDYGVPDEESGPEGPEPHLRDALAHAKRHGIVT